MTDVTAAEQSQWRNLEQSSGKSQAQWLELAASKGFSKHSELVNWLKSEFGIGHGNANLIAHRAKQAAAGGEPAAEDLLAAQYSGAKAALKPLYDELISYIQTLGSDVELSPKKAYVSVRRNKQFALLQPSTASRLDLGLNLKGVEPEGKLEASGSFNAMCSHRIRITTADDIDDVVKHYLAQAYNRS
jgi:predicted transport protein